MWIPVGIIAALALLGGGKKKSRKAQPAEAAEDEQLAEIAQSQGAGVVDEVWPVEEYPQEPEPPVVAPPVVPAPPVPVEPPPHVPSEVVTDDEETIVVSPADAAQALDDDDGDEPLVTEAAEVDVQIPLAPVEQPPSPMTPQLEEIDAEAEAEGIEVEPPPEEPPAPPVAEVPIAPVPTPPETVPQDTAALVAGMLAEEATPRWKRQSPALAKWQEARGLKPDGLFGVKSALRMAEEIGTLPIIRYWPRGSYREGPWIEEYRQNLRAVGARSGEARRVKLNASALREQGQGFGQPVQPIRNLVALATA